MGHEGSRYYSRQAVAAGTRVKSTVNPLLSQIEKARTFDLAQPYFVGMPHHPAHPPFLFGLVKKHGDIVLPGEVSSAAEALALGAHVGTHIDALCHFSCGGKLYGGVDVAGKQTYGEGFTTHSVATIPPILRRGVLLDIPAVAGIETLPKEFAVTPEHLEAAKSRAGVKVGPGDVVLLRTGWARFFNDPIQFITGGVGSQPKGPGPELAGAEWLSARGVFAAGSDTVAFERVPSGMPVHVHLLVEKGIHIIEMLNLEELAAARVYEFLFVAAPLKIHGGTGSPIRPVAVAT
jgi:kynurenine formamidase